MRHTIDPLMQVGPQARAAGFMEPYRNVALYRFLDASNALLYVGITSRPIERWQKHRRSAHWWPSVAAVLVEVYPHRREAEVAELAAIKTERPAFNVQASPSRFMNESGIDPTSLTRYSEVVLPRVGVGVGGGGGFGAIHASRLTRASSRPVDNATADTAHDRLGWMAAPRQIGGRS